MSYFTTLDSFFHHSEREIVEEFTRRHLDPRDDATDYIATSFHQSYEVDRSLDVYEQLTGTVGADMDE